MLRFTTKPTHVIDGRCLARFHDWHHDIGRNVRGLLIQSIDAEGNPIGQGCRVALCDDSDRVALHRMWPSVRALFDLPIDAEDEPV